MYIHVVWQEKINSDLYFCTFQERIEQPFVSYIKFVDKVCITFILNEYKLDKWISKITMEYFENYES